MNNRPDVSITFAIANACLAALHAVLVTFGHYPENDEDEDEDFDDWDETDTQALYVILNTYVSRRVGRVVLVAGPNTPFDTYLPGRVTNALCALLTTKVNDPI